MQELITLKNNTPVIDSIAISDGAQVTHQAVMKIIRGFINDFNEFGGVGFEIQPFETAGGTQKREIAFLNEDQAMLLFTFLRNTEVARKLKVRVVKAFAECRAELAKQKAAPQYEVPPTYAGALRLAADLADKAIALEQQIEEDRPQVAFAKGIQATAKEETITGAAKILGIKPKAFFDWLRLSGFIYKQSAQATAKSIDAGLMVVRFAAIQHEDDVEKKAYAHVTGKGLYYFYTKLKTIGLISRNENLELAV